MKEIIAAIENALASKQETIDLQKWQIANLEKALEEAEGRCKDAV